MGHYTLYCVIFCYSSYLYYYCYYYHYDRRCDTEYIFCFKVLLLLTLVQMHFLQELSNQFPIYCKKFRIQIFILSLSILVSNLSFGWNNPWWYFGLSILCVSNCKIAAKGSLCAIEYLSSHPQRQITRSKDVSQQQHR